MDFFLPAVKKLLVLFDVVLIIPHLWHFSTTHMMLNSFLPVI